MKNIYFIFHQRSAYAVDWATLVNLPQPDDMFILVTTNECMTKLSDQDKASFTSIVEVDQFGFEELIVKIRLSLADIYDQGDTIRIAVMSEFTMTVAANVRDYLRNMFNIIGPGDEVIGNFRDKVRMKKLLSQHGVRLPKYQTFIASEYAADQETYLNQLEETLGYPMFMKPTDSGGSIGTALVKDRAALLSWCEQAAQDKKQLYEIDEFIDGTLYHCDSMIKDGQVVATFVNQYLHPNADARVGKTLASITMHPDATDYEPLKKFAESTLKHFPVIPDGFTHMEIFKSKRGELIFLEVAARPPGAKAPDNFKIRTGGLDMRWIHFRLNLGLPIDDQLAHLQNPNNWGPFAAMFQQVAPASGGFVTRLNEPDFRGGGYKKECQYQPGDQIKPNYSILDTTCSCVFWNNNYDELMADFAELDSQPLTEVSEYPLVQAEHFLPNFIHTPIQLVKGYLWSLLDSFSNYALEHARKVVKECPSYFPPNCPNYWSSGGSSTFFNKSLVCNQSIAQISAVNTTNLIR